MKRIILMMIVVMFLAGCATQEKPEKTRLMPDKGRVK
jgi:PBP1b-binding outer membrane lipoprotein LpoB